MYSGQLVITYIPAWFPLFTISVGIYKNFLCLLGCFGERNGNSFSWHYYSSIAWKIPWTEEPGGLQSMGSQRVGRDWATNTHLPAYFEALSRVLERKEKSDHYCSRSDFFVVSSAVCFIWYVFILSIMYYFQLLWAKVTVFSLPYRNKNQCDTRMTSLFRGRILYEFIGAKLRDLTIEEK